MRWLGTIIIVAVALAARANYLPAIGPAPLRFQSPAQEVAAVALPPLPSGEAPPDGDGKEIAAPATVATNLVLAPTPTPTNLVVRLLTETNAAPQAATNVVVAPVIIGGANDSSFLAPQMFIQFFRQNGAGATNRETGVVLPLNFAPPPVPVRSSTATFNKP